MEKYSQETKQKLVNAVEAGMSFAKAGKLFGVSAVSAKKWCGVAKVKSQHKQCVAQEKKWGKWVLQKQNNKKMALKHICTADDCEWLIKTGAYATCFWQGCPNSSNALHQ